MNSTAPKFEQHYVRSTSILPPFPDSLETIYLGGGCFWGLEELFWPLEGVYTTFVGYGGGHAQNPTYSQVCQGDTGHIELVGVVFDPEIISCAEILALFWQSHDPTQIAAQGADIGTQYQSAIFTTCQYQQDLAYKTRDIYQKELTAFHYGSIGTIIAPLSSFYYAEDYHQQYLAKNPHGYRCHAHTGIVFPDIDIAPQSKADHQLY